MIVVIGLARERFILKYFHRVAQGHSTSFVCLLARLFVDQPSISLSPLSEKLLEIANRAVRQHNDHRLEPLQTLTL